MNPRLVLAAGTFVTWTGTTMRLGNVSLPADLWEVNYEIADRLLSFSRPRELSAVVSTVPTSAQSALLKVLQEFRDCGLLVPESERDQHQDNPRTPQFELSRHLDIYLDIDTVSPEFQSLYERIRPYTLTSVPMAYSLYQATRYIAAASIPGAIVECGVWRGGSMLMAAAAVLELGEPDRELWHYDTFNWSWEPRGARDGYIFDGLRREQFRGPGRASLSQVAGPEIMGTSLDEVRDRLRGTGYPENLLRFVPGLVQDTIPHEVPGQISLLRLDTDFYESTWHELKFLYPLISPGGVLIIDDYAKHEGATRAVDEYFATHQPVPLLNRVDIQGRIGVKPTG